MRRCWWLVGLLLMAAGCAAPPAGQTAAGPAESQRQFMCVSKVYVSDVSQAHTLSGSLGGREFTVPVGEWLDSQLAARFWQDATVRASGRPQPTITAGFAPGTGVRPAGFNDAEVQLVVQLQLLKPTGQDYYDLIGGRATANTAAEATNDALEQVLRQLEMLLVNAGLCRQVQ